MGAITGFVINMELYPSKSPETMTVTINGKKVQRRVDYYKTSADFITDISKNLIQAIPVLADDETMATTVTGETIIFKR